MSEWKEIKLADFIDFNPTESIKKGYVARKITMDMLIPHSKFIPTYTYEPYTGGTKFKNGDTIMARITPCLENGKHAFVSILEENEIAYGSTEYIVLRGKKDISDNDFVYYLSKTPKFKNTAIKSMVGSSGRQRAQVDTLKNLMMFLPSSLAEQQRIASILSSLDAKIENNNKINAKLEEIAQNLFKEWFVDFGPFKNGKFVESELGLIPEGWRVGTLGEICAYSKRKISTQSLNESNYFSTENMLPNKAGVTIASSIPEVDMVTGCMEYDVLVSNIRPYFKKIFRVNGVAGCSADVLCFHPNGSKFYSYLYCILYEDNFFAYVMSGAKGTKMPRGDKNQIMKYPILLPEESILGNFSNIVEPIFERIKTMKEENQRLATLRDTLLPKLMSGEIEV